MNMWQQGQQQAALPFSILPGLMGGTYSNPVVDQGGGGMNIGGGLSGAGMGYLGAMGTAATAPYALPIAGLMGLGGLFS